MKILRSLPLTLLVLAILSAPLLARQPAEEVLNAARKASPTARWKAAQHLRQAYPGLAADMVSQLKSHYPDLEHSVVDAVLDTWQAHPDLAVTIADKVRAEHGEELQAARQDVMAALEAAYPDFRRRLAAVLREKGMLATWQRFVDNYDPGLRDELRQTAGVAWRPGLLRDAILNGTPGTHPLLERLRSVRQGQGPETARRVVSIVRRRAPGLAADFTQRWLDGRKELAEALRAEFPGAGKVVAETLQARHPQLVQQVLATIEPQTRQARADLRANLNKRLPGFTDEVEGLLTARYPHLRQELTGILKG